MNGPKRPVADRTEKPMIGSHVRTAPTISVVPESVVASTLPMPLIGPPAVAIGPSLHRLGEQRSVALRAGEGQ